MPIQQGIETEKFGRWLTNYLKDFPYQVYYDHGDSQNDLNVFSIKGFYGDQVHNINRLADIDIMVASKNNIVKILIEIEGRPISPKKLLGDILAILMCNKFAIRKGTNQEYFIINDRTELIIAGTLPNQGSRIERIDKIIKPRLYNLSGYSDGLRPKNIHLIFDKTILSTIDKLKQFNYAI